MCGLLFNRRNSKYACNRTEQDMVYIHRESGVFGEEAHQLLIQFINERQDREWQYIEKEETEKETPHITSDPPIIPTRRKESRKPPSKPTYKTKRSPTPLEEPEIEIEEPPRERRRKVEAVLKDLETSKFVLILILSYSSSESDLASSDSEDDDDERKLRYRNRGSLVLENHNKEKDVSDKIRKEKDERIVKMKETRGDERSKKDLEQDSNRKENNEITPSIRQTETEVHEMISGHTKVTNIRADLENNKVNVDDKHNERQDDEDIVIENKNQNAKESEDENNIQNVNELTCESKGVEKQCIDERKDRDKNDNNKGSAVLDTIMDEMTATFSQTQTSSSDKETENAVLSIIDKSNNTDVETSYDVVSECAYELVEEIIINSEIENAVENVNGNLEQKRITPEKRKLDRTDLHQEPREKKTL